MAGPEAHVEGEAALLGFGVVVGNVPSARGMVLVSRSRERGRVFVGRGVGESGEVDDDGVDCELRCGPLSRAFSSHAARDEWSTGHATGLPPSDAMPRTSIRVARVWVCFSRFDAIVIDLG